MLTDGRCHTEIVHNPTHLAFPSQQRVIMSFAPHKSQDELIIKPGGSSFSGCGDKHVQLKYNSAMVVQEYCIRPEGTALSEVT